MPNTRCERCDTVGFVRREHVIARGNSLILFYCGHCNQTWEVAETPEADKKIPSSSHNEPPDHSR